MISECFQEYAVGSCFTSQCFMGLGRSKEMDSTRTLLLLAAEFGSPQQHPLAHDLSSFELHVRTGWYDNIDFGVAGIAANAGFCQSNLENPKVPQFHIAPGGQGIGDGVKRVLDDREYRFRYLR